MITLIKAGGFYNIALVVFHLLFWRLFNWDEDLRSLSFINRATMQVMNLSLVVVFALFAYLSLVHSYELFATAGARGAVVDRGAVPAACAAAGGVLPPAALAVVPLPAVLPGR